MALPPIRAVTPPAIGTIGAGELLVEASTRRIWLGVAATTDPLQAILISDMFALQAEDLDIRADTAAALNTGLAGKANTAHTHTASQITDFTAAVQAVVGPAAAGIPSGCIVIWSGQISEIGVGAMSGWVLCNGLNGTPDLQDRFVVGAGRAYAKGDAYGSRDVAYYTDNDGTHGHGQATGWTALTVRQMPYHTHIIRDPGHRHLVRFGPGTIGTGYGAVRSTSGGQTVGTDATLTADYTGILNEYEGASEGHYHVIGLDGYHRHFVNIVNGNMPPYYALAYIMKL